MLRLKYPNIILFLSSITIAVILSWVGVFEYLSHLKNFGYAGAFISGLLWPFTFATPLATASFFYLGQTLNIWNIIILGSVGALFSDLFIWKFFKGGIFAELERIWQIYESHHRRRFTRQHKPHLIELFHSRPFHFISLFTGVILLFSPLPDEIGLEMLSYYKFDSKKLVILSLASSAIAVWLVANAGRLALG